MVREERDEDELVRLGYDLNDFDYLLLVCGFEESGERKEGEGKRESDDETDATRLT